jgi:transcription elongation factor GreB
LDFVFRRSHFDVRISGVGSVSKAFVKEDQGPDEDLLDGDLPDEDEDEGGSKIARGSKNYITTVGFERLKTEIHELLTVERPKVVDVVAWAASNGDRSENADYTYGKKRLREIDRRIRFLQKRIDAAEVVDPVRQSGDKVLFGATVTVLDEDEKQRVYRIVGIDETDAKTGKVSWISPIGQALLQSRAGEFVTLKTPKGEEELEIVRVEYLPID